MIGWTKVRLEGPLTRPQNATLFIDPTQKGEVIRQKLTEMGVDISGVRCVTTDRHPLMCFLLVDSIDLRSIPLFLNHPLARSVAEEYATAVSHIFTVPNSPERTILMAPASTSALTAAKMEREFGSVLRTRASMVSTEISQVPLSGVLYLLEAARQAGKPSLLDIDVTPEMALGPAQLGASMPPTRTHAHAHTLLPSGLGRAHTK